MKRKRPKLFFCIYCLPSIKYYKGKNKQLLKKSTSRRERHFKYHEEVDEYLDAEFLKMEELNSASYLGCGDPECEICLKKYWDA